MASEDLGDGRDLHHGRLRRRAGAVLRRQGAAVRRQRTRTSRAYLGPPDGAPVLRPRGRRRRSRISSCSRNSRYRAEARRRFESCPPEARHHPQHVRRLPDEGRAKLSRDALADDFTFTSPYDDAIDKADYFERCWPVSRTHRTNEVERIFAQGDAGLRAPIGSDQQGRRIPQHRVLRVRRRQVKSIDVYFGASYRDGVFVKRRA